MKNKKRNQKNQTIDVSKVIHLEFTYKRKKLDKSRIKFMADFVNISYEWLLELSKDATRVWIYREDGKESVVFSTENNTCYICEDFKNLSRECRDEILALQPVAIPKNSKTKVATKVTENFYDVDTILDKIIDFGIDKLTKEELTFLDSQKYSS
jgi:hypothetical protein